MKTARAHLVALLSTFVLSGCGSSEEATASPLDAGRQEGGRGGAGVGQGGAAPSGAGGLAGGPGGEETGRGGASGASGGAGGGGEGPGSRFMTMRDGVRIAVDVWMPEGSGPFPVVMRMTRYWRGTRYVTPEARAEDREEAINRGLVSSGFAVVAVDARGSGASFGVCRAPWAPEEIADYRELLGWVVEQPWCDGGVVSMGISYDGNTAMLLSASGHPAVKAVAPLFPDYDPYLAVVYPGGVLNASFVGAWAAYTRALDVNDDCALASFMGQSCEERRAKIAGPRPVDEEALGQALSGHEANLDLMAAVVAAPHRDDALGEGGPTYEDIAPYGLAAAIDGAGVPWFTRLGWLDGNTVAGALSAYNSLKNPQTLVIGATGHAGLAPGDPLAGAAARVDPPIEQQLAETFTFLAETLAGKPAGRQIRYQTLGEGAWRVTESWPPEGTVTRVLHLAGGAALVEGGAPSEAGVDEREVDMTATTGPRNRWRTPLDAGPVLYADRSQEDEKLITYTSEPLEADVRVTGDPSVTLYVSSSGEGALFVYLEDVAPGGEVTYVTEGQLALAHRKAGPSPYPMAGPSRSFRRADAAPVVPGEVMMLEVGLSPTSALLRKGHRVRVAIAGADEGTFVVPAAPGLRHAVHRGGATPSSVRLPVATGP